MNGTSSTCEWVLYVLCLFAAVVLLIAAFFHTASGVHGFASTDCLKVILFQTVSTLLPVRRAFAFWSVYSRTGILPCLCGRVFHPILCSIINSINSSIFPVKNHIY